MNQGFAQLIGDLSKAFKPNQWLLSTTVLARPNGADATYDIPQLMQNFDWVSLQFDFYSSYGGRTEHIAPLYGTNNVNINSTVQYWIGKGVPSENLILGISAAGLSFTLENPNNHGLNAPSSHAGNEGPFTSVPGTMAYYEICNNTQNGWNVVHDKMGTYAYHGDQWVSFDDVENVRVKAKYIHDMGLGGGMLWSLDFDDFHGSCGCGKYPLLTALNQDLRGNAGKQIDNCT